MKILYGITKSNFGGAQRYVYELAREAKHRGHDTAVLLGGRGILTEKLDSRDIRSIEIPGFGRDVDLFKDAPRLWFIMKSVWHEKPDVFHINSAKMGGAGIFTTRMLNLYALFAGHPHRIEVIFTAHGWEFNGPRPEWQKILIKFFVWLTILFSHKVICVSEKTKADVVSWPFVKKKCAVIHNGIASFELLPREEARQALGIKGETFVTGTISELRLIKGPDILLRAWKDFRRENEGALVVIGDGEERDKLHALTRALNIQDSVYFLGFMDNARKFLKAFDVFVLASRSEALPYAPLEAGLASLPVIATEVGGVPEIIKDLETGALVQPEYPEEICHVLQNFSKDPELMRTLGANLKKFVEEEYSLKQMFDKTFALYK